MINDYNRFKPGDLCAVGDLHGRLDLLLEVLEGLKDTGVELLFLGDLIDRAKNPGDDLKILDLIKSMTDDPEPYGFSAVSCLMGNHEDMFVKAARTLERGPFDSDGHIDLWAYNGGDLDNLEAMSRHTDWLADLPLYKQVGKTLFVHAGVRPNIALEDQVKNDLVWIRDQFLNAQYVNVPGVNLVIHGHTPNFWGNPVVTKDRVCLDTGAFHTGVLTLYNNRSGELIRVEA